jgi:acyl-CoA thioester hydrolase
MKQNYIKKIKYKHCTPIQIRFDDVDIAGHVNNAVYFSFLNYARMVYLKDVTGNNYDWNNFGLVIVNMNIDFFEPIFMDDTVEVCTKVVKLGNKSMEMVQGVFKDTEKGKVEVASCKTILVGYDYAKKESLSIPSELKEKLVEYEKNLVLT